MLQPSENQAFAQILEPWYASLRNTAETQRSVFSSLIKLYEQTEYGRANTASAVSKIDEFRDRFPKLDYGKLVGYLEKVKQGNHLAILPEPPVSWVMTRGTTGSAKVLPATKSHLEQVLSCGARALANYIVRKQDWELSAGKILNLNFPSRIGTDDSSGIMVNYGYSSGTYARLFPSFGKVGLVPLQDEVDALGSGITKLDWKRRFELVYERALEENVTAAMGVAPVILSFARFVKREHRKLLRDSLNVRALFCTSVRKIQFKYAPRLRSFFGEIPVVEIYSATEGVFAQQLDDLPYVTPNYDKYLFEVETGSGVKMLHDLRRGEWGRLIISSCMFPRYDIGDMIEAKGKNYFRVFGRAKPIHILEHRLHRLLFGWFI